MPQLTAEERRRIFVARQRRNEQMVTRRPAPTVDAAPVDSRRRLSRIVRTAAILALLSAGWLAWHTVELHVPASIAEALPRV